MHPLSSALALLALAAPVAASAPLPPAPATVGNKSDDLRCAATVAIVAAEQARGNPRALDLPPLANRGRRYFALVGNRSVAETGRTPEQVRDALAAEVLAQRKTAGADPDAALTAAFARCQPRLDAAVPPLIVPDLAQCAALAALGASDRRAEEGDSAEVRTLDTLAFALAGQQRRALARAGVRPADAEAALRRVREEMARAIAAAGADGIERYDFDRCVAMARETKTANGD